MLPTIEDWRAMDATDQTNTIKKLGANLPGEFVFQSLSEFELGGIANRVAFFSNNDALFAFIPGGTVELGFDANCWLPNPDEKESWRDTAEEYGIQATTQEHLASVTKSRRRTTIQPLLVETMAREVGWQPIAENDPRVRETFEVVSAGRSRSFTISHGDDQVRAYIADNASIVTEQIIEDLTHSTLSKALAENGFRCPSMDEWEYLCSAGALTLFRWGDHAPCDRYPTDLSIEEAKWRRLWVASGGQLPYPEAGFVSDWTYHTRPNAFGLILAHNPYKQELVHEENMTRGGDGGCAICGGAGFFAGWLPLASAFWDQDFCLLDGEGRISPGYTIGRRVFELK